MFHALVTLAAEHVEPDKTAYYIGGGLLVAWAIALSVIGLSRPDFPENSGAARGVMGASILLTIVTMVTVLATP